MDNVDLIKEGNIYILKMQNGENRFSQPFIDNINTALDEVETSIGPTALITTGSEKFYSNGLDLDWMSKEEGIKEGTDFIKNMDKLYVRILTFPMVTAACINGHAFGGGAIIAMVHDYMVMRFDRGYFCLPEIDIKLPFTPVMNAVIMSKFFGQTLRDLTLTGMRFSGETAMDKGIVDVAVPEDEIMNRCITYLTPLANKDRKTMGAIKRMQFKRVLFALELLE